MLDHVTIRVTDLDASRSFYTLALGDPSHDQDGFVEWGVFSLLQDTRTTKGLHIAFGVPSRDQVDAWWQRLVDAGYSSDGEPGPRPQYSESYYGAFVLDPDGNSAEAVTHDNPRQGIDHLWLRTRDVGAARDFYETVGPVVGVQLVRDLPERVTFVTGSASFTFVRGDEATENVHFAFGVPDEATVDAFHETATAGGYRDNGAPGERPQYHPGYYGAYVLDPDGHNVEAVFHDRTLGSGPPQ